MRNYETRLIKRGRLVLKVVLYANFIPIFPSYIRGRRIINIFDEYWNMRKKSYLEYIEI